MNRGRDMVSFRVNEDEGVELEIIMMTMYYDTILFIVPETIIHGHPGTIPAQFTTTKT